MARSLLRAALVGALLVLPLLGGAAPAWAHAVLLSSAPADQEVLDTSPTAVELRFNEPVGAEADAVHVLDRDGARVDTGQVTTDSTGRTVTAGLRADLPQGTYVVSWRVVSGDAHPIRGGFVFSVGEPVELGEIGAGAVPLTGEADRSVAESALVRLNRFVLLLATLLAAGGLLFLGVVHDGRTDEQRRLGRLVALLAAVAALATATGVLAQSFQLHGSLGAAASGVGGILATSYGAAAALRLVGLTAVVALAVGLLGRWSAPRSRWATPATVVAALATVGSFALTGHTVLSEPRWLATAANVGHTFTAAAWIGGLALLALCLRARRAAGDAQGAGRIVARFSRLAIGTIALLAVAGGTLAWVEVRTTGALLGTDYGRTLLVKLGLIAAVGAVALYNHRGLVPALRRSGGNAAALARLRSTVRFEVVGLVLAVAVTSVLVDFTPAARALAEPTTEVVQLGDDAAVELTVLDPRAGRAEVHLYLLDDAGRPRAGAQEVVVRFSSEEAGIAPISRTPTRAGPGHWQVRADALSVPGTWEVEVVVRLSDFDQRTASFVIRVT